MDTDRGDARADYRTGIMGTRAENACRKGKALSFRNNRAVCTQGALCGMWLHAAFLENQGEILSAMPQSSHFQGELQGGVYFRGAAGADGFAGITGDFRCLSKSGGAGTAA